jgi:hypothetical protein
MNLSIKLLTMADNKMVMEQAGVDELPLSAEDRARLERLEQLKAEAAELARPMIEKMQVHNSKERESFVVARMGSAFSFR